jgi:uncharacterized protein YhhL (DUF1145 family)
MNKTAIMNFGKTVLAVVVGIGVYNIVMPMVNKAKVSTPSVSE